MVGKDIKSYLKENGIKQNFVAQKIGIPATTLNSMLSEKQKLSVDIYFRICYVLGESPLRFAPSFEKTMSIAQRKVETELEKTDDATA